MSDTSVYEPEIRALLGGIPWPDAGGEEKMVPPAEGRHPRPVGNCSRVPRLRNIERTTEFPAV